MRKMAKWAAISAVCVAGLACGAVPAGAQGSGQLAMAKFESGCFGDSYFVIREMGYSDNIIRFTLGMGQKIHFQIPAGSTYAMSCNGWPGGNSSWNSIRYD